MDVGGVLIPKGPEKVFFCIEKDQKKVFFYVGTLKLGKLSCFEADFEMLITPVP